MIYQQIFLLVMQSGSWDPTPTKEPLTICQSYPACDFSVVFSVFIIPCNRQLSSERIPAPYLVNIPLATGVSGDSPEGREPVLCFKCVASALRAFNQLTEYGSHIRLLQRLECLRIHKGMTLMARCKWSTLINMTWHRPPYAPHGYDSTKECKP